MAGKFTDEDYIKMFRVRPALTMNAMAEEYGISRQTLHKKKKELVRRRLIDPLSEDVGYTFEVACNGVTDVISSVGDEFKVGMFKECLDIQITKKIIRNELRDRLLSGAELSSAESNILKETFAVTVPRI